jgi:RNA polymerase sigma factor (sigma-70 family)
MAAGLADPVIWRRRRAPRVESRRRDVELAMRGDHDAFAALAAANVDRLYAIARLIVRDADRAEDATQETLVKAWRELPRLRDPDRFDAWLRRLLVNACHDEGRRVRQVADVRILPPPATVPGPERGVADRELVDRGLRRIPVEQRAVLVLHHYLELSHAEIATVLAIPVGTVKSRLRYATRAMRAALEADDRGLRPVAADGVP